MCIQSKLCVTIYKALITWHGARLHQRTLIPATDTECRATLWSKPSQRLVDLRYQNAQPTPGLVMTLFGQPDSRPGTAYLPALDNSTAIAGPFKRQFKDEFSLIHHRNL